MSKIDEGKTYNVSNAYLGQKIDELDEHTRENLSSFKRYLESVESCSGVAALFGVILCIVSVVNSAMIYTNKTILNDIKSYTERNNKSLHDTYEWMRDNNRLINQLGEQINRVPIEEELDDTVYKEFVKALRVRTETAIKEHVKKELANTPLVIEFPLIEKPTEIENE